MSVTVATFRTKFPEFTNAADNEIQAALDDALLLCPSDRWGAKQDMGVCLQAAQALALSPFSRDMAYTTKDGTTTIYDDRLARLRRLISPGLRVIGGC